MGAPSHIAQYDTAYGTTSTPKTVTVNANAGDVLLLFVETGEYSTTAGTPTNSGTGLTWTKIATAGTVNSYAPVTAWAATVDTDRTGMTVSVALTAGSEYWGFSVSVWRGSDGIGANAFARGWGGAPSPAVNSDTPYVAVTTTQANSAVQFMATDYYETVGTAAFRTTAGAVTSMLVYQGVGSYAYMARHANVGAVGSKTVGMSAPTQHWAMVAVEIKGSALQDDQVSVASVATVSPVLDVRNNVAPSASASASSVSVAGGAAKINDRLLTNSEWVQGAGSPVGQWAQLTWSAPTALKSVVLYDRVDANNQVTGGTLTFSDGSSVAVGSLPNDGATGLEVEFTSREVTWVRFTVDTVSGTTTAVGLTEFEAYFDETLKTVAVAVSAAASVQTGFSILTALQERGEFEVAICDRDDVATLGASAPPIAYLSRFADVVYLDERNRDGGGSLRVPLDLVNNEYKDAIKYGQIVRVGISGDVVGWFEIEKINTVQVASEAWVTLSGQGPLAWTSRAVVFPTSDIVQVGYTSPAITAGATSWAVGGSKTSPVFTVDADDYLIVMAVAAEDGTAHFGTPTNSGTGLTWTSLQEVFESGHGIVQAWWAKVPAARASITVSVTWSVTDEEWGFTVFRARGATGIGASVKTTGHGRPRVSMTTTAASSVVLVGHEDWNGHRGTQSWREINGETPTVTSYERISAPDTMSTAYYVNAGPAGSVTAGMTSPDDQAYSLVAVEVLGTPDSSPTITFGPAAKNRRFDFTSAAGNWYVTADWVNTTKVKDLDPIDDVPEDWPDFDSWTDWVWDRSSSFPKGDVFLRGTFTTSQVQSCEVFATVDDVATVVLDGEVIITMDQECEWETTSRATLSELPAGTHVVAIHARNVVGDAGVAVMLRTMADDPDDAGDLIIRTGSTDSTVATNVSWKICGYPAQQPGWTVGQMLTTLLDEADARGVDGLNRLTRGFTETVDSNDESWVGKVPWVFTIGSDYRSVLERVIQTACDVWVDGDLKLNVAQARGVDMSESVMFAPGYNIAHAEFQPASRELVNQVLVETDDGYKSTHDSVGSQQLYGRRERFFTAPTDGTLDLVMNVVWAVQSLPQRHPTLTIEAVQNAVPWRDFNVGDWVMAPSDDDPLVLVRRRVASIGVSQDPETGVPRYGVEIDSIAEVAEIELARRMERATSGLLSYFEYTPNPAPPESVTIGERRRRHRARGHRRCSVCHELIPHRDSHDGLHSEDSRLWDEAESLWGSGAVGGLWTEAGNLSSRITALGG